MPTKPGPPVRFAACRVQVAFLLFFPPRRLSPDCFSQWTEPEDTASQSNSVFATLRDWQSRTVYEKGVRPALCLRNRLKNRFALWPRPTPRACHQHVATCESIKMLRSLTDATALVILALPRAVMASLGPPSLVADDFQL